MTRYVVNVSTNLLVHTWWGKKWCENILGLADFENRLARGRNYLRKGAIKELYIEKGEINAKVKGYADEPYAITITIDPLDVNCANRIRQKFNHISGIKNNYIPKDCLFLYEAETGLLPSNNEIHFSCSCPDSAIMCKHIIAVMYAIGCILDQKPLFLFDLRGIDISMGKHEIELNEINSFLSRIDDDDFSTANSCFLSQLFDIDLGDINRVSNTLIEDKVHYPDDVVYVEALSNDEWDKIIMERKTILFNNETNVKTRTNTFKGKVLKQYDCYGNLIGEYQSYDQAERETGIDRRKMQRCICGEKKTGGGFVWFMEKTNQKI